jgi:hypothetical protein
MVIDDVATENVLALVPTVPNYPYKSLFMAHGQGRVRCIRLFQKKEIVQRKSYPLLQ